MNRYEEAIDVHHRLYEREGRVPINAAGLGVSYALAGRRPEALDQLRVLEELSAQRYVPPTAFARIHAALGDLDQAFGWMDRAVQQRDRYVVLMRASPSFDQMRDDPRFDDLIRRVEQAAAPMGSTP